MQSGHAIKEATFLRHTDIRVPAEDLQVWGLKLLVYQALSY
jgi:hypothetical protein